MHEKLPNADTSLESPLRRRVLRGLTSIGVLTAAGPLFSACIDHGETPAPAKSSSGSENDGFPDIQLSDSNEQLRQRPEWLKALAHETDEEKVNVYIEDVYYIAIGYGSIARNWETGWGDANLMAHKRLDDLPVENQRTDLKGEFYIDPKTNILYYPMKAKVKVDKK